MELDRSTYTIYYQKIKSYIILLPPIHNSIGGNDNDFRLTQRPVRIDQRHVCV